MREIIVDNFAGGGGASTGIELAIGRSVDIAINHDPNAVAMHTTNHPDTLHYCESVFDVNPLVATASRPVGLAWFSPDCRHFSKAKGSKPVEKEIRGLAWIVIRWALAVRPRVMMLENVEEFKTWGPLIVSADAGQRPDPDRAGETFEAFCGMLSGGIPAGHPALAECCEFLGIAADGELAQQLVAGLGYAVDHRELRACDFGAPTIRKRFFMVMRCDGVPVTWPVPTHGDPKTPAVQGGKLAPWRTAAECIDWSIPAQSIFDRKKPLAENTLKRIARGIQRFVIDSASPFIVKCNHTTTKGKYDCFRGQSLAEPLQTITKTHGYAIAVPTVTPFLAGSGGSEYQAKPRPLDKPMHTILKESRACVVAPVIARQFGASIGHRADEPSATITAGGGKFGLVAANLVKHFGGNYQGAGVALDEPVHTVTTTDHHAVVAAHLMVNNTGHPGGAADQPAHTVTTGNHHAAVTSHLVMLRGTCRDGRVVDAPAPGLTAGGLHVGNVETSLATGGYDEQRAAQVLAFLREYCGVDSDGLVTVDGVVYRIVDIGMRMLQPAELYRAQGFPEWYIIDQDYRGVKYAKDKQVARCGNAVPPPFAEALVRVNLPEMCEQREWAA
ncbi:DNA cytosine methyltransferase [Leclercia sp. LSNIH1]|uniref:DNA cytosine methyltransferase n=1 Tax=Leclercia sp. LSNIH1 TaxID=1920114 RepID=UPI000CD29A59|nr:DNA cytosine methyltransferase [Leclercia sp. LSNIH1]AUU85390.1 DNA cytosine methyltransferase [Leclercia sp. LSNIH1]POV33989.1 DNA cytosine methyltransferase [Leclercia sp. LSNIH5]POW66415.1 DNA cytosine methyltransferase [Leclercia sp. LSNIH2]